MHSSFYIQKGHIYAIPITHYNMEMAAEVRRLFLELKPDCVAVELPESCQSLLLRAASRLPDLSVITLTNANNQAIYYMCEPCDASLEGLRSALERNIPAFCIDLEVSGYPQIRDNLPDEYSIQKIGLQAYYELCKKPLFKNKNIAHQDEEREVYMAKRLKELSFSYDRILFISGMAHVENVLKLIDRTQFPSLPPSSSQAQIYTLTEKSSREVMAECAWFTLQYEITRSQLSFAPPDRHKLIYDLYKSASEQYIKNTGHQFPGYHLRNLMKFSRNYALISDKLMPDLFQILASSKGCVDHNFAYETWELATFYPFLKNVDNLPSIDLTIEDVWGKSKLMRFHLKEKSKKNLLSMPQRKDRTKFNFKPPNPFTICSYPPEDIVIERFGDFLKKKGTQLLTDESSRTIPFTTSLEDGVDTKETIRHWHEKKLYVKASGKPPGAVGSVVVIFNEDAPEKGRDYLERYPWCTTWIGEHNQESDMAFYATSMRANVVGPGISRCEYGGFMMSYPPRRLFDIWSDPDYQACQSKSEILLAAAIDYAVQPIIVYVASKPPRSLLKSYAKRFGKKVVYLPIGQLSPITLNKLRVFHVLDGHHKRLIADEYIF